MTGIVVERCSISASVLSCSDERWMMTTKASPDRPAWRAKNACSAGMLPAEPPRPTIGTSVAARRDDVVDQRRELFLGMVGRRLAFGDPVANPPDGDRP